MFALLAVTLALPALAAPSTTGNLFARAAVSGCSCFGQTVSGSAEALFTQFNKNGLGWCFENGQLRSEWVTRVSSALESGAATDFINTPAALQQCADAGITDTTACTTYLVDNFENAILGTSHSSTQFITNCANYARMEEGMYTPTDCQCGYECIAPFEPCGDVCYYPGDQDCNSGMPSDKFQITRREVCPAGTEPCLARSGAPGWECLNTASDIEACGGCPGSQTAEDCTTLPGAATVSCQYGKCFVDSCARGFRLVDNECIRVSRW